MAIRKGTPARFVAQGISDSLDGTDAFPGSCALLSNLIPDVTTKGIWVPRPAATLLTNFPGFTTPGFISAGYILGTRFYGLIASGRNAGHDEPFIYDIVAGSFATLTGVTALNTPTSPVTTGAWEPPTMALVGTKLVVTHSGFNYASGQAFGWFETSDPTAVTWSAGNTTGALALPARPNAVAQFGGRAWFLVNPASGQPTAYFTDILLLNITSTTQALTFDDNKQLTAAVGLPLENQLGGIVQSLIIFKSASNMYQVTGDLALSTLAKNAMNVATGTLAPRAIAVTPKGVAFVAPDGVRLVDFNARITDPVGEEGVGVNQPFVDALYPSRMVAASNANTYRVTVQNGGAAGTPTSEYWYDIVKQKWSGPHTLPLDLALPYNNTFVVVPRGIPASLWQSDVVNTSLSTFTENGVNLQCVMQTSLLPDTLAMAENAVTESAVEIVLPLPPATVTVNAMDEDGVAIVPAVTLLRVGGGPSYWGTAIWGTSLWYGGSVKLRSVQVPWAKPIVFKRMSINIAFNASTGLRVGAFSMRYQQLGYLQQ
jgi:hypothetical protein